MPFTVLRRVCDVVGCRTVTILVNPGESADQHLERARLEVLAHEHPALLVMSMRPVLESHAAAVSHALTAKRRAL